MSWDVVIEGLSRPEAPCPDGDSAIWCSDIAGEGACVMASIRQLADLNEPSLSFSSARLRSEATKMASGYFRWASI